MENASQALIMAGGILVGIIIISMGVYLFSQAAAIPENYNATIEQQKLQAFNSQFETYCNKQNGTSAQDIITVLNMATDNNKEYTENEDYYINVYLDGKSINSYTENQKVELMQATNGTSDFYSFECEAIEYSTMSGRIKNIKFIKK